MKKTSLTLIPVVLLLSHTAVAADGYNPNVNPANIINTFSQTLPGAQEPSQGTFDITRSPQYIQHAKEVTEKITIQKINLQHATVIPPTVQKLIQATIGKKLSFTEIQQLATQIEQTYRNAGYLLIQVILPPQEIDPKSGVIQLDVINGQIEKVIFEGDDPHGAKNQLQRYAEQIEVEDPISYHSIDRFLVLANNLPGIDVSATLAPNKSTPGGADLIVHVEQTRFSSFINTNNRGTSNIGPYQTSIGASTYDVFGADSFTLVGASTINGFMKEMQYGSASYDIVFDPYATEINPNITRTLTSPAGNLSSLEIDGQSIKYDLGVYQPLYTSTDQNFTLQSDFYHIESQNDSLGTQLYNDKVTAMSLGLNYQGAFWQTYHDITFSTTVGLPVLDVPNTLDNPSINNAKTTFVHLNLLSSQIHYLTQQISVGLNSQFQYSPQTLVSSEQIGFGGQQFGQAFDPYIISGNSGAMGSLSLRYDLPLAWGFTQLQPNIFYDAGAVFYTPADGASSRASAQSAGVGMNMIWSKYVNMSFTVAKPLRITQTQYDMGWAEFFNITLLTQ